MNSLQSYSNLAKETKKLQPNVLAVFRNMYNFGSWLFWILLTCKLPNPGISLRQWNDYWRFQQSFPFTARTSSTYDNFALARECARVCACVWDSLSTVYTVAHKMLHRLSPVPRQRLVARAPPENIDPHTLLYEQLCVARGNINIEARASPLENIFARLLRA